VGWRVLWRLESVVDPGLGFTFGALVTLWFSLPAVVPTAAAEN